MTRCSVAIDLNRGFGPTNFNLMEINMSYANQIGYTDITPFEIIRTVSEKCLEIREMDAVRSNPENKLGFIPGGFCGHHANQDEQEWAITSNPENRVVRIRLRKNGQWRDKYDNRFVLSWKPKKFYDYNF